MHIELKQIIRYPLKACKATSVPSSKVNVTGLEMDRLLALSDKEGKIITARTHPRLAALEIALVSDQEIQVNHRNQLLRFKLKESSSLGLTHFSNNFQGVRLSEEADAFFSEFINSPCHLVRNHPVDKRYLNPKYGKPHWEIHMVDASPLLLISQNSVDALNEQLSKKVDPLVFRPNLIIEGNEAFSELHWKHLQIGKIPFEVNKACGRCRLITLDLETLEFRTDGEPLKSLSQRSPEGPIVFGIYLLPLQEGILHRNDTLLLG